MKKTELGLVESINWMVGHNIWDNWYHWRLQQMPEGYSDRDDKYALLYSMPEYYDWHIDPSTDEMRFRWHDGEERVPLSVFINDHDEQPDLEMLWHSNYYDGPLSGMAEYNGEMVWFQCNFSHPPIEDIHNIIEPDSHRRYVLYRLSDEDREELCQRHQTFRDMVGWHCDHKPEEYKPFGGNPRMDEFYEQKKDKKHRKIDTKSGEVLGEFAWYQFGNYSVRKSAPSDES